MPRGDSYQLQGQMGGVVLEGTNAAPVGNYRWLQIVTDTVIQSMTSSNLTGASTKLVGKTLPAGLGIGGNITELVLTSGTVILYRD